MDEISALQPVQLSAVHGDDPLLLFLPEPEKTGTESLHRLAPRTDATLDCEPPAAALAPKTNAPGARTAELVNHLTRAMGAFDLVRDLAHTVDRRFAALQHLEHEVSDHTATLELLKAGILEGTARADDVVRSIKSFEPQLVDLKEREQGLRTVETIVAAFEDRARTTTTDLEGRVGDCEARTHAAAETIARLDDASARTLPELNQRLTEADEKHQVIDQKITEAVQVANSLGALLEQLPAVSRCDQELARIELVVPQVQRRLKDLDERIPQQILALAANQERADRALQDGQKSRAIVSELETRIADLSRSHEKLNGIEERVGQLEARAADAASDFVQATCAKNGLELEVVALQNQFRRVAEAGDDETKKLVALKERTERYQHEQAEKASAVLCALENRMADVNERYQLLNRVEQQLTPLEERTQTVAVELNQAAAARNGLEQEVVELRNQLQRIAEQSSDEAKRLVEIKQQGERSQHEHTQQATAVLVELQNQLQRLKELGDDQSEKLVEIKQQGERYQHEQAERASAVLSALETRMADVRGGHQQLALFEQQLGLLEARTDSVAGELKQAADSRNGLEREIVELENQLRRMTELRQDEAKKLAETNQQAKRYHHEQASRTTAVVSALEIRMADIRDGRQQLDLVEQQLKLLEARSAAAVAEVTQANGASDSLEREVARLENQLEQLTEVAANQAKKVADLKQHAEHYQREEAEHVSAVLSGLELRIANIDRSCRQLAAADKQVTDLEQRARTASAAVRQASEIRSALQNEIDELHNELPRLTEAVDAEAKMLASLKQQTERQRLYRASTTDDDGGATRRESRRRASKMWLLSPNGLVTGGVSVALFLVVVVLVGGVWRFGQTERNRPVKPITPPRLTSRTIEFTPMTAVALLTPATLSDSSERHDNRSAAPAPAASSPQVTVSLPPAVASGSEVAVVRDQPPASGGDLGQFIGALVIESEPAGATAFVNQQSVGETPIVLKGLRVGSYVVRVESDGYRRWSKAVTVSTIHETRVTATLQRDSN